MANKKKDAAEQLDLNQDGFMDEMVADFMEGGILGKDPISEQEESNGEPDHEAPTETTSENIELRQQVGELKDKYIRLVAEFDNFKKRSIREKMDWMKSAAQETISSLLPVLDDFDRARKFAEGGSDNEGKGLDEGVELVYQKLYNTLRQKGLEPMESTGEVFDPELHEAITEIPSPTDEMKGKVIDTVEKGYRLNDKIIRHAKVVVGK